MRAPTLVILGGGPTALACALHAARERTVKVLLPERTIPHRIWIEAVPLHVLAGLVELGIHPRIIGAFKVMDRRLVAWESAAVHQESMNAVHIERPALELALLEKCAGLSSIELRACGAAKARAEGLWHRQRGATLVDASGRSAIFATQRAKPARPWVARLFDVAPPKDHEAPPFMLAAMPQGYVYRVQGHRCCTLGVVGRGSWLAGSADCMRSRIAESAAAWLVEDIPAPWTALGAKPASVQWTSGDVALQIGDAGLARDALSSQGLASGLRDAKYAAITRTDEEREALSERARRARTDHAMTLAKMIATCRWRRNPVWDDYARFIQTTARPEQAGV